MLNTLIMHVKHTTVSDKLTRLVVVPGQLRTDLSVVRC